MSILRFEISLSLDGYVTAADPRLEEPMGDGGQVLHEWAFGDAEGGREVHADSQDSVGASIAGRRTYDTSIADWGAGDRDIVFSADIGGQLLRAGLVDEVRLHLVPVLFGSGTRLLDDTGGHVRLELTSVVQEPSATHLRYLVVRDDPGPGGVRAPPVHPRPVHRCPVHPRPVHPRPVLRCPGHWSRGHGDAHPARGLHAVPER